MIVSNQIYAREMNEERASAIAAAGPAASIGETLASLTAKSNDEAKKTYALAVRDSADGKQLTNDRVRELAEALHRLARSESDFLADVGMVRQHRDATKQIASIGYSPAEEQAHAEKVARIKADIDRLQVELRTSVATFDSRCRVNAELTGRCERLANQLKHVTEFVPDLLGRPKAEEAKPAGWEEAVGSTLPKSSGGKRAAATSTK